MNIRRSSKIPCSSSTRLGTGRAKLYQATGWNRLNYRIFRRGSVASIQVSRTTADLNDRIRVTFTGARFGRNTEWNSFSVRLFGGTTSTLFTNPTRVGAATNGRAVFDVTPALCGRLPIFSLMLADRGSPDSGSFRDPENVLHGRRGYLNRRVIMRRRGAVVVPAPAPNPTAFVVVRAAAGQTCPARPRSQITPTPTGVNCPPGQSYDPSTQSCR